VFEDKALADEAVAAVEKVVQHDTMDRITSADKGPTAENKENLV
jgi:hypothetical protein